MNNKEFKLKIKNLSIYQKCILFKIMKNKITRIKYSEYRNPVFILDEFFEFRSIEILVNESFLKNIGGNLYILEPNFENNKENLDYLISFM